MKIAIGIMGFLAVRGGAQRATAKLANELLARGHEIFIMCHDYGRPVPYSLAAGIRILTIPTEFQSYGSISDMRHVRGMIALENPDAFISIEWGYPHMLWSLACLGTGVPFICSERTDPRYMESVSWSRAGRHAVLASADLIHELSPAHLETIPPIWIPKTRVIPNAAPVFHTGADAGATDGKRTVLFLGRFMESKRGVLLIRAFARLAEKFPEWTLEFKGQGIERDTMQREASAFGLSDRISVEEPPDEVQGEYAKASIYCLPTRVEGFPNSALEAMAAGLPVVGIADCPAMRELADGGCALLARDATPESLADVLAQLMSDAGLRERLGQNSLSLCTGKYNHARVHDAWEKLLADAAAMRGHTVMDSFRDEPFASMATLSSAARREWLYRDFGDPMPRTFAWLRSRIGNFYTNTKKKVVNALF